MIDLSQLVWRKSSRSGGNGGACVEVAVTWRKSSRSTNNGSCVEVATSLGRVLLRDSKDPDGPALAVDPAAWRAFLDTLDQH